MFRGDKLGVSLARRGLGTSATPKTVFTNRSFSSSIYRRQQQQQHQQPQQQQQQTEQPSSFKEGMTAFRPFGSPFLKVFLGAIFTYQVIYYAWKKLETNEKMLLKNEEIKGLEKEAKELAAAKGK